MITMASSDWVLEFCELCAHPSQNFRTQPELAIVIIQNTVQRVRTLRAHFSQPRKREIFCQLTIAVIWLDWPARYVAIYCQPFTLAGSGCVLEFCEGCAHNSQNSRTQSELGIVIIQSTAILASVNLPSIKNLLHKIFFLSADYCGHMAAQAG